MDGGYEARAETVYLPSLTILTNYSSDNTIELAIDSDIYLYLYALSFYRKK